VGCGYRQDILRQVAQLTRGHSDMSGRGPLQQQQQQQGSSSSRAAAAAIHMLHCSQKLKAAASMIDASDMEHTPAPCNKDNKGS
jgi:hypothetical protein